MTARRSRPSQKVEVVYVDQHGRRLVRKMTDGALQRLKAENKALRAENTRLTTEVKALARRVRILKLTTQLQRARPKKP